MFGLLRKVTKTVVYTAIPVAGPLKAATMGTRKGNLTRKEMRRQTALLEQQNALLARPSGPPARMVTPDGAWVSLDGGETWHRPTA